MNLKIIIDEEVIDYKMKVKEYEKHRDAVKKRNETREYKTNVVIFYITGLLTILLSVLFAFRDDTYIPAYIMMIAYFGVRYYVVKVSEVD